MSRIRLLMEEHRAWREGGVNLIASENRPSEQVRMAMASDLQSRYHSKWYGGTRVVREIIAATEELACEIFGCRHAIVTPLAGNLCDLAVILAFTKPGDRVAMVPQEAGGYPLNVSLFSRVRQDLPMKAGTYEVDEIAAAGLRKDCALVLAGSSFIPFPHPMHCFGTSGGRLVFDGSHVLGLIACGVFQNPLEEGADVLIGSTHKSLPGPQGGMVLTQSDELHQALVQVLDFGLEGGIGLVDNPHPGRIAALGLALEELAEDPSYGERVVENARALAGALENQGVPVRFREKGYTASQQIFLDLDLDAGTTLSAALEEEGVFVDIAGRLGTAEVTRLGMGPADMLGVAATIARAWNAQDLPTL